MKDLRIRGKNTFSGNEIKNHPQTWARIFVDESTYASLQQRTLDALNDADRLADAIERFEKASINPPKDRRSDEGVAWCEEWESARHGLTQILKAYRGEE